jgi:hypothetical protein
MNAATEKIVDHAAPQLRTGALGLIEVIGQSLAAIAPTLTPALNITESRRLPESDVGWPISSAHWAW